MTAQNDLESKSFEELLEMLEDTIKRLDSNSLTLAESIDTYEQSVAISAACEKILNESELRITQIDVRKPRIIEESLDDQDEYEF